MVGSGVTYAMPVTLLTSHCPMSWLNIDALRNIRLCADTRQREGRTADASSGPRTRQWCWVGVGSDAYIEIVIRKVLVLVVVMVVAGSI